MPSLPPLPTPLLRLRSSQLNPTLRTPLRWISGIVLAQLALALASYPFLQPSIPLFYSLAQSTSQLAPKEFVFIFPAIGLLIALLARIGMRLTKSIDSILLQLFAWTTVVLISLSLLAMVRIILLVL